MSLRAEKERGLTLVELLVVMAVIGILAVFFISVPDRNGWAKAIRIQCVNNLKQIGLADQMWAGNHSGDHPWEISKTNGGAMEGKTTEWKTSNSLKSATCSSLTNVQTDC